MRINLSSVRRLFMGVVFLLAATLLVHGVAQGQEDTAETDLAADPVEGEAKPAGEGEQVSAQEVLEKGEEALKEKDFQTALGAFDQLAKSGERSITQEGFQLRIVGYTGRAKALAGLTDYEAALEDFKLAFDLQENFVPALLARGQMYFDMVSPENYPSALADFQKAVKAERGNMLAQFGLGKANVLTGNNQAAIGPLTRVLEATPENAEALRLRGSAYAALYKVNEAIDDLQKSISINPQDYETYYTLGMIYLRGQDYQSALNQIAKAIEFYKPKTPDDELPFVQAYLTRASIYIEMGKAVEDKNAKNAAFQASIEEAEKLLGKIDRASPYTAGIQAAALYGRGVAERMLGQLGKAILTFSEAIALNPELGEAYFRRGICFHLTNEDRMAISDFVEAANIDFGDPRANLWEGFTRAKLGEYHEAVRAYGNAIAASDRYTPAFLNRGLAYMALGDYDKAVTDFSECIRLEPTAPDYYFKRGLAYAQLNDHQKAADSFDGAIRLDPRYAAAYRHLADSLQALGKTNEANEARKMANELTPKRHVE